LTFFFGIHSFAQIVEAAVTQTGFALRYASQDLRGKRDLVMFSKGGYALQFTTKEVCADKEVVLAMVSQDGYALQFAADALRADSEVVFVAVSNDWRAMAFCGEVLCDNVGFVLNLMSFDWRVVQFASQKVVEHPQISALTEECAALAMFADETAQRAFSSSSSSILNEGSVEFESSNSQFQVIPLPEDEALPEQSAQRSQSDDRDVSDETDQSVSTGDPLVAEAEISGLSTLKDGDGGILTPLDEVLPAPESSHGVDQTDCDKRVGAPVLDSTDRLTASVRLQDKSAPGESMRPKSPLTFFFQPSAARPSPELYVRMSPSRKGFTI
jgi:hypothetical protein